MQGLQPSVVLAAGLAWAAVSAPELHAASVNDSFPERQAPVANQSSRAIELVTPAGRHTAPTVIQEPGARFIKVHFSAFKLPPGMAVEVSSPDRSEVYRYATLKRDAFTVDATVGDNGRDRFSALSVTGDTAVIRLTGRSAQFDPRHHRVAIDTILHPGATANPPWRSDNPLNRSGDGRDRTESDCGLEERLDAVCWAASFPGEYERSQPVAMLVTSRGIECTAWRVGDSNHMFTAQHCIGSQSDLNGAEIWFNYETDACGGEEASNPVKVSGKSLLATDATLDYALFTVNGFSSIRKFGNLGLDVRQGENGEFIFIPQHGLGKPRQISIESDKNASGFCEIDDNDRNAYGKGTDIAYYCDTTTSSSGSPVISAITGRVIALHHLGGCANRGSKISLIWPQVAGHFDNRVPEGDGGAYWAPANQVPDAQFSAECEDLSCTFDAADSGDPDGRIREYSWAFGDGSTASGEQVEYRFESGGTFPVTLTVEDDEGALGTLTAEVEVSQANQEPLARFSFACVGRACAFDAGSSSDPDGTIDEWLWNFGDGHEASGEKVDHEFTNAGSYRVLLSVSDDEGADTVTSRTVVVRKPNEAPTAEFSFTCALNECTLDAGGSADPDGSIRYWSWNLGDGSSAKGTVVNHSYAKPGDYAVTLTVTDDAGARASTTRTLSVTLPDNEAPEAGIQVSCDGLECALDASSSRDPDGSLVAWQWTMGDGTTRYGRKASHEFAGDGEYTVTLTVTDNRGAASSASQSIVVEKPREIVLTAASQTQESRVLAFLKWQGAEGDAVVILRDGEAVLETGNDGVYYDTGLDSFSRAAVYQVCETGAGLCSNSVTLRINP